LSIPTNNIKKLLVISALFLSGCEVLLLGGMIDVICDDDYECWSTAIDVLLESESQDYDYDWDWDQFYDQNYNLVWRCRGIQTGRFGVSENCNYDYQDDNRWPGK